MRKAELVLKGYWVHLFFQNQKNNIDSKIIKIEALITFFS